ncbi:MAG: head maturation protease, ClpP-related, partial [Polaromonas sp.]
MRPCFKITASATAEKPTVISVFEDIGFWGTQAKDFIASVNASVSADIHVEINSNGGDVFAALAMYNALRASGKTVTTKVMGIAASAASLVLMAGDKRVMPKNTHVMIHNPSMFVGGNADALDEVAAMLRKIGSSVQATYAARTGMKDEDLATMLATDTWMTADECL